MLSENPGRLFGPHLQALVARREDAPITRGVARAQGPSDIDQVHPPETGRQVSLGDPGVVPEIQPGDPGEPVGALPVEDGQDALAIGHAFVLVKLETRGSLVRLHAFGKRECVLVMWFAPTAQGPCPPPGM